MELIIKLKPVATNPFDGSKPPTDVEERQALKAVALEVKALNQAMAGLLTNGPIPCNPDSEAYEGYLGDVNSRPNEFGYVRIRIGNYDSLDWPDITPATFSLALGEPVRGDSVRVGVIA